MASTSLFVAPAWPLSSRALPLSRCARRRRAAQPAVLSPRMSVPPPSSSSSPHPADDENNNNNNNNNNDHHDDARFARFSEFVSSHDGDAALQNQLVTEVLWAATRAATTQNMESTIQMQIDAVSELLSDLYTKSQRDMQRRNEELAIRTSLPNISKWNQQLIEGHKQSKLRRSQISKELAIVHALLKRTARSRAKRARSNTRVAVVLASSSSPPSSSSESRSLRAARSGATEARNAVLFTLLLCACALEAFENVVSHDNGPSSLAQYSAIGALFVLCCAYVHELRAVHRRAVHRLHVHSTPTSSRAKAPGRGDR